jgi:hypothetical protein
MTVYGVVGLLGPTPPGVVPLGVFAPGLSDGGVVSSGTLPCEGVSLGELVPDPVAASRRRRRVPLVSLSSVDCSTPLRSESGSVVAPVPVLSTPPGVPLAPLVPSPVVSPLVPVPPVPPVPPPVCADAPSASETRAIASRLRRLW